ncbi:hypothetical protein DXG01_002178 [Tephrocybe rancida]|nr:hypothetical protein DXG01_002178 [Tephrocybe rancida]
MTAIPANSSSSSSVLPQFENTDEELAYLRAELLALKQQVKDVEHVCGAVARGDLTQKVEQGGDLVNGMVENLKLFAREVKELSREVRTEGTLGGQAQASNAEGEWREITDIIHNFASNHTSLIREISQVTRGVALGDFSKRVELDVRGEALELKNTVNGMTVRLERMATEVSSVTRDVGTYGKLGGQANVSDVEGDWLVLVMNVNCLCASLTDQVRAVSDVTAAVASGDFTKKIALSGEGELRTLQDSVNSMVDQLSAIVSEVTRVTVEDGTKGMLWSQVRVECVQGAWAELMGSVNTMASNSTNIVRAVAEVAKAVALGDLTKQIDLDVQGEMLELKFIMNSMVSTLGLIANEVTRVSLEVGTEGRLGGQASVPEVQGVWKAIAGGDLERLLVYDARGEMLECKEALNGLSRTLSGFADEITRSTREVGAEGKLGGQARLMWAGGTWKDVVGSVNVLANNLTLQTRVLAVVITAVARGDFTQKIVGMDVSGEMLALVNSVNDLIDQLAREKASSEAK